VPRRTYNVIPLRSRGSSEALPVPLERLGVAVRELDDLRSCIERIVGDPRWSAREWRVACAPLMLRLPRARHSLADLAGIRAGRWPDTDWAVRLRAACDEVERRLLDVSLSMSSLVQEETSSIGAVVNFSADGSKLAEAVDDLCVLIASQYPEAIDDL
jgi:hypothetical protein